MNELRFFFFFILFLFNKCHFKVKSNLYTFISIIFCNSIWAVLVSWCYQKKEKSIAQRSWIILDWPPINGWFYDRLAILQFILNEFLLEFFVFFTYFRFYFFKLEKPMFKVGSVSAFTFDLNQTENKDHFFFENCQIIFFSGIGLCWHDGNRLNSLSVRRHPALVLVSLSSLWFT